LEGLLKYYALSQIIISRVIAQFGPTDQTRRYDQYLKEWLSLKRRIFKGGDGRQKALAARGKVLNF
jgi:hypothetical protein